MAFKASGEELSFFFSMVVRVALVTSVALVALVTLAALVTLVALASEVVWVSTEFLGFASGRNLAFVAFKA